MAKTKVLITVKTYPSISSKYDELVCTAGFTEDGKWIRIYPIQFRKLDYGNQYSKYDWIEIDLVKNTSDFRYESFRPVTIDTEPNKVGSVNTSKDWKERRKLVLNNVYFDMSLLISEAKDKEIGTSLAVFKPTKIIDFIWKPVSKDWTSNQKAVMSQYSIFEKKGSDFKIVKKLPYKFSYVFEDCNGKRSNMMIEDWELGALFWKYKNEVEACNKVKDQYFNNFALKRDLHFYLGTTQVYHNVAPNPFIIIGALPLPIQQVEKQLSLFLDI